ncbi:type IV secretory system conjugative DNA transfer family protein [Microbacterium sp. NPDC086615]|uniref:type IV secretory system conjugative DNA transfer family protein n=1 Tax=Microbacterium sp. NPDC086615 TaxID=3154865 RepID=UPI00343EC1F0
MHLLLRAASPRSFDEASQPLWWQNRLTVREATALSGLPIGDELPGLPPLHPVQLAPTVTVQPGENRIILAEATASGYTGPISLSEDAILRGLAMLGPVGVGKSDATAQLVLQWVNQGRAAVVCEPKRDLTDALVARIAPEHRARIVHLDLFSEDGVIGLNPLRLNGRSPEVVVDGLVSIFSSVLSDVIGVTTRDLLNSALLALVQYPGATLLMLPLLLSDPKFRRKVVANISGDVFLQAYFAEFEAKTEQARAQLVAPVLVRLRQLLLRPSFRRCLGQAEPKFDVRQVFGGEKKVLLVPLPKAQLGAQGVALLGSLLLHEVFGAINERAVVEPAKRHPVMIAVDEWHHFIHGTQDFAEALTLFRGYGAGFVLANQVMAQLTRELREVVTGTVRSRVYFQLGADDALSLSRHSPELEAIDLMRLEQFHIYAALYEQGKTQPFVSGRTIKLPDPVSEPSEVVAESHRRYGIPPEEVDRAVAELYEAGDTGAGDEGRPPPGIGRRPRPTNNR